MDIRLAVSLVFPLSSPPGQPLHALRAFCPDHVAERHVEEETDGYRQDPGLTLLADANRERNIEAGEGRERRGQIQQQRPGCRQPSVQQGREVSWGGLVRVRRRFPPPQAPPPPR